MKANFHLSIGVRSIEESVDFFTQVLRAKITHRDPSGYVNIDLLGSQITLKENPTIVPKLPDFHFGLNLILSQFDELAKHVQAQYPHVIISSPRIVDANTTIDRKKMYIRCPTGYLIEIKGYRCHGRKLKFT